MKMQLGIALFGLLTFAFTADGLKCVDCTDCASSWPNPIECPVGQVCLKAVGSQNGREAVIRKCEHAIIEAKNGDCEDKAGGGKLCVYTCKTDGCNGSPVRFQPPGQWIVLCGILLLFLNNYKEWF